MTLQPQSILAIGIDYQEKLLPAIHELDSLVENSVKLFTGLQLLNIPLIMTEQYPKGLGHTIEAIRSVTGQAAYFDKTTFSCYRDEATRAAIDGRHVDAVIVCGIEAHVCVLQSVIDLREAGFKVVVVTDCISSRKKTDKKYAIKRLSQEGALVGTYESVLFELLQGSHAPQFKEVSKLFR